LKPDPVPPPVAHGRVGEQVLAEPPPELRFRRRVRLVPAIREVWRSRELIRTLAERQLRARYKQAVLGFGWAILTPLVLMVVFTVFFQPVADVDTGGVPYPLFAYLGILPWTFFSSSVSEGGQSLVQNMPILNKVYCPREVFPMSSIAVAGVDSSIALIVLLGLFIVESFAPSPTSVWVPVIALVQLTFTLGMTLIVSALLVYLRDLRHMLPIVLQLGLFVTPVAYGMEAIPQQYRMLYSALNPLAPVIDGYRRTVLMGLQPNWGLLLAGATTSLILLIVGYVSFKRLETGFADVA
jgi:ABC-2 type transport system permease protein/lipopolysaccharide transport system permease protein